MNFFRAFGVPVSLRNRNKLRLIKTFETKKDALERTILTNEKIKGVSIVTTIYVIFYS